MLLNFDEERLVNYCAWLVIATGVVSIISGYFLATPYGRYSREGWGFGIDARLAWFLQESPSFIIPCSLLWFNDGRMVLMSLQPNTAVLSMFLIHYFRRSFIYPLWIKNTASTPFFIFLSAFFFCSLNGYMQGQYHLYLAHYPEDWFQSYQFIFGCLIFLSGFAMNLYFDYIITNLRKPGETGHKIPRGGLFEYVSCPNFFGEIVEWGGYALASSSFVAFAFFFNTFIQLGVRAFYHHRFYHKKFEDYPKNRKAVIPFVF
ncbi:3-oxo-5-alpha-steroid 4-dehydrogenase 1-like [Dendronephthya gigantea]|uniref:3-oxo-5-alpha-steroid 4-dehydrogenase 1-like n=1 Tax=Dendronephthya gigantea TaxID=151771 RepID=UPI00106A0998|nr:3-oxo-5-alpha-steroid 4-dehydrogenase 1-like [Dendronephthya gigantea]